MPDEPVVMIPPLLCDARVFADQIGALSAARGVMVLPWGAGETLGVMAEAMLKIAPPTFALVAAGLGGALALQMLDKAPERITRLALINVSAQSDTPNAAAEREAQIIAAQAGRFEDVIAQELPVSRLHDTTEKAPIAAMFREMGRAIGAEIYITHTKALQRRKDQQGLLRKIAQPVRVISGAADPDMPLRRQEFIAEMIPYADYKVIESAGMMPTLEAPTEVAEVLVDWLKQPLVLR